MSSLGNTLRQAREAKGLTQSQVASQTRILVQIIDDIENEDFHRIAAPIYGRGFVRLYAECVDLDPQPLIREFMDIYEGRRAPTVLVRDIPTEAPATLVPESEPVTVTIKEPAVAPDPYVEELANVPETIDVPTIEPEPSAELPDTSDSVIGESTPLEHVEASKELFPEDVQPETEVPPQQTPFAPTSLPATSPFEAESEHLWDPPTADSGATAAEPPPQIVRGLDLFDQAAGIPPSPPTPAPATMEPTSAPPLQTTESPFLPPIYEDNGPSAAERFKNGISSVSHGVLRSVRRIPRSAWRKTVLVLGAASMLAVMILGCIKLYQMTTTAQDTCENGVCEYNPPAKPHATEPIAKASPVPQTPPVPRTSGKIHSTGQKVTPLYID